MDNNELVIAKAQKAKQKRDAEQARLDSQKEMFESFLSDLDRLLGKGIPIDGIDTLDDATSRIEQYGQALSDCVTRLISCSAPLHELDIPDNIVFKQVADPELIRKLDELGRNDLSDKFLQLDGTIKVLGDTLKKSQNINEYQAVRVVVGDDDNLSWLRSFPTPVFSGGGTVGGATEAKQNEIIAAIEGISGSVSYRTEIRTVGTLTYIGKAVLGSATSSAVWQIKRLDTTSGLSKLWADGNDNFDNIFDNRASLSYS